MSNNKYTYNELGQGTAYIYELSNRNVSQTMLVSDTVETLNVVYGDDNGIKRMITDVVNIGNDISELEENCFRECSNLSCVHIPTTLSTIGSNAFKDCHNLTYFKNGEFYVPMEVGNNVFENCGFTEIKIKQLSNITFYNSPTMGEKVFAENSRLQKVHMQHLLLGKNMFHNCSSLSSITFDQKAETIYSEAQPFSNCKNLQIIKMPESISGYYQIHTETLKDSNILSIYMPGMDYDECEFAVGKGTQIEYYTESTEQDISEIPQKYNIKKGGVYYLDVTKIAQGEINMAWKSMVINKTPCFIVFCNDGCSRCKSYVKDVLKNEDFLKWLVEYNKCAVVYLNANHSEDTRFYYLNPEPSVTFKCNNDTFYYNYSPFGKMPESELDNLKLGKNKYIPKFRIKIDDKYNIQKILKVNDIDGIKRTNDIFNDDYYTEHSIKNAMCAYDRVDPHDRVYPIWSYFHFNNSTDVRTASYIKLDDESKKKILKGQNFKKTLRSGGDDNKMITLHFTFDEEYKHIENARSSSGRYSRYFYYSVNDRIMKLYISGVGSDNEFNLTVQDNCIFIKFNTWRWSQGGCWDTVTTTDVSPSNDKINSLKNAIERTMNRLNAIASTKPPPKIIQVETAGDCWGIGHDCVVIDKNGKKHTFKYTNPSPQ